MRLTISVSFIFHIVTATMQPPPGAEDCPSGHLVA